LGLRAPAGAPRLWLLAYVSSVSDGRCSHLSHSPPLSLFPNAPLPQPSHLRFSPVICSLTVPTTTASSSYSTWSLLLVTFPHIGRAITVGNGVFSGQCVPRTRLTKWDVPTNRKCIAVSRLSAMTSHMPMNSFLVRSFPTLLPFHVCATPPHVLSSHRAENATRHQE